MSVAAWLGVALAGGLGAIVRVSVARTLVVNVSGAFALGVLVGAGVDGEARFVLAVGLLGGYTTFSTWMFQSRGGRGIAVPLALGFAAVVVGRELGRQLT